MNIVNELNNQLTSDDFEIKQAAEDCLLIADKVREILGGLYYYEWQTLVRVTKRKTDKTCWRKPTEIGKIFLKGLKTL